MSQQFSGQLGLRQVQGEVQKGSGKCWIFLPLRSESPCFFLRKWILSKETDSEDLHWSFFHDRLGSLTLKIMWRIFCLACCCPGEACFSNAFTSVSAQAGTSKNHPSKRQMTEMKWSLLHLTDSEKTFLLSHASLISPSSTLSPVRTTRSGWGHSTGRTWSSVKGETANWIIKLHPIAKRSQLSSQNTHCPSKELVFMAFRHLCLGFWWKNFA